MTTWAQFDACSREPIHLPGSIQPYGLLFVVDKTTDLILQAAGNAAVLIGFCGTVLGNTARDVLGISLKELIQRADAVLLQEPVFIGTIRPSGDHRELAIAAHLVDGFSVVEVLPSVTPAPSAQTLASIRSITERIGVSSDLVKACELAASEVRRITGYDRVLVYQFLPDASGSVIAESNDGQLPQLMNQRFPASDIPAQARELYRRNPIRAIPDVSYTPALLVPERSPMTNRPLDMSHCLLRSVSPVHIEYLKNMGVGASMSVSLLSGSELWGLIAGHNTTPRIVTYEAQETCRHVGQILSQKVREQEASHGHRVASDLSKVRDRVMGTLFAAEDPEALLRTLGPRLQSIVPSNGAGIVWKGAVVLTGASPTEGQVSQLANWLEHRMSNGECYATDRLSEAYPAAKAFAAEASGLLAVRIPGDDPVMLMWFRAEQVEEVNWSGNPHEPLKAGGNLGALNPRRSFATWCETVRGHSRPWQAVEIDSARMFSPRIAFVLQQKRVRELNRLLGAANERLGVLASQDGLTGIANRRTFDERLSIECARASRARQPLGLLILDVDFFKPYNDNYGHAMGDACLKMVANVLRDKRRAADLAARIGGEEFAVLLPNIDREGAMSVAESIRARIEALRLPHTKSPLGVVTASVGVAVAAADRAETVQALMATADKALYKAKTSGRNRAELGKCSHMDALSGQEAVTNSEADDA